MRICEPSAIPLRETAYWAKCCSAGCAQVANVFSLFLRDCRLFLYVTTVPRNKTKKIKKRPGPSYEQTQFASYNQSRESPEGLFSGRLHATNSSDEFAFRRDGGYHSRSQPFCGINTSRYGEAAGTKQGRDGEKREITTEKKKGDEGKRGRAKVRSYARSNCLLTYLKCLNVASLAGTGVNFIGTRFNIVGRDGAPHRALDSLARLRIGRKLGCVNFKLNYEAMKRRPSITWRTSPSRELCRS